MSLTMMILKKGVNICHGCIPLLRVAFTLKSFIVTRYVCGLNVLVPFWVPGAEFCNHEPWGQIVSSFPGLASGLFTEKGRISSGRVAPLKIRPVGSKQPFCKRLPLAANTYFPQKWWSLQNLPFKPLLRSLIIFIF